MCLITVFQHSCGCSIPLEDAIERCHEANKENIETCDNVQEQITADPYPCMACFEKQADQDAEQQMRDAIAASADDYVRRAKEQEQEEYMRAMAKSMQGVRLEDRWEADDVKMQGLLKESRAEFFKRQEEELRARGLVGRSSVPRGEWTRRETVHDRPAPLREAGSVWKGGFATQGDENDFDDESDDSDGDAEQALPPSPKEPINSTRKLEDYPPNVGPNGLRHPLILYHFMGCGHDIDGGLDYSIEVSPNEANAVRNPRPGKCPACGGKPVPPAFEGKGKGKAVASSGLHPSMLAVEKLAEEVAEMSLDNGSQPPEEDEPVEREISPAEIRAKRLAALAKQGR